MKWVTITHEASDIRVLVGFQDGTDAIVIESMRVECWTVHRTWVPASDADSERVQQNALSYYAIAIAAHTAGKSSVWLP